MAHSYNVMPTITSFAFAIVCKRIKSLGYKVVITGIGGDELFKGYYHHFISFLYSIRNKSYFKEYYNLWEKIRNRILDQKSIKILR